ncbi:MAG: hypothetical protein RQ863_05340, partial [Sulfolobales archaeon]|nr:hypothetical protein [Sulfolobales archaeon]
MKMVTIYTVYSVLVPLFLAFSLWTYLTGDEILHIMSYQGPIVAGGMLGWMAIMRSNKDRVYAPSVTEELLPIMGLILRKYAPF